MSKQDRQGARTPAQLEQEYKFGESFAKAFGLAEDAGKKADEAKSAVDKLDKKLTQEEIFNRLTKNGEVEGIYRDEAGNVYINASYMVSGILRSKDGSTFYLDLDNGILKGQFAEFSIGGKTVAEIAQEKADAAKTYADRAAANAVDAQTQTDIFNKLTNNGALKGLYMENGELYINASYLMSGIINASLVKAGVITSNDDSVKIDLINNKIELGEWAGSNWSGENKSVLDAFGYAGYGKHYSTGEFVKTLAITPGAKLSANAATVNEILALGGIGLSISTNGGNLYLGDTKAPTKLSGSAITVEGEMQTDSINPGKTKLFSGNVAMGNSCTVPNTGRYDLFSVKLGDDSTTYDTVVLAYKSGNVVRGVGGWAGTASQSEQLYFFSATISGDTWTVEDAGVHNVYFDGTVGEGTRLNLKEIIGVI